MDQRYPVVAGAWLTQFTVIGLMFTFGLLFDVFEEEFGWQRVVLSSATSIAFLMMGVLAILAGQVADRWGPRVVLACSGLLFGAGYMLIAQVTEPWQLLVLFATLIALGMSTHDVVTLSLIARWFEKRRGVMTALVKVGTACGQFSLPPLAAWAILSFGWQTALTLLGGAAAAVLLSAALLTRAPPPPERAADGSAATVPGYSFAAARQSSTFWRICVVQFMFFASLMTIPVHIVPHGTDLGLELGAAAALLSVMAAASIAGRIGVGAFVDRIGGRRAYVICFVPLILSLVALLVVTSPMALYAVIALYGFAHGGFFTVVSPTVAEFFGLRAHGAIFGVVLFCGTIGGAVGPLLAGWVFDTTGSYSPAFITLAVMGAAGLATALSLPRIGPPSGETA
ncbi:MAG: MFS transporter [Paracoccaceae bacterium]